MLTICNYGCGRAGSQGGRKLLDGVEDGVAISLLALGQLPEPVGHDIAETQPDAEHEADIEDDNETIGKSSAKEGESCQTDHGDKAARENGNSSAELVVDSP